MRDNRFADPVMRVWIGVDGFRSAHRAISARARRAHHVIASIVWSAHRVIASGVDISGFVTSASTRSRSTLVRARRFVTSAFISVIVVLVR